MQHREAPPSASRRAVVISPTSRMVDELEPLLQAHLPGAAHKPRPQLPFASRSGGALGGGAPHVVFLDVVSDREQALQLLTEIARLGPSIQVIALLAGNEPDLILRCLRAGAVDFLIQPFTADQIEAASREARPPAARRRRPGKEPAKIFAVMPAKGACGATTIACNLAFQWKRLGAKKVLLADLDPLAGTTLVPAQDQVDLQLPRRAAARPTSWTRTCGAPWSRNVNGVDVLLAPELMVEGTQDLHDPSPILEYARHAYDVVVIDTGGVYGEWNLNTARAWPTSFCWSPPMSCPPCRPRSARLSYLDTNRIGRWKIRLLVNRYHRDVGLSREVIGTALHTEVFDILPSDYEAVQKSLMDGKPAPPSTAFGKSIMQLADRLGGKSETAKKSTSLGGLLGLFGKTSKST